MSDQTTKQDVLLEVKGLKKYFDVQRGFFNRKVATVKAVDGVTFKIRQGQTLGLVGESGCGKTTTGRVILRAMDPTAGEVWFNHPSLGKVNLPDLERKEMKLARQSMQMIFQDPNSSLNPRMTLLQIIGDPLVVNGVNNRKEVQDRVAALLKMVGLRPEYINHYPHAFSGGQRQRIGIARALALNPKFLVCDEPVSALDVSIQAQILNLLQSLQKELGLTYLFISHDLSVVEHISDHVAVMYVGKLVEHAPTRDIFTSPKHPYTQVLIAAVPKPDPTQPQAQINLEGEVADPANPPSGCAFHPRCPIAVEHCKIEEPLLRELAPEHFVACHLAK
jgi:peptide/nickel transport system ATP-binding protein